MIVKPQRFFTTQAVIAMLADDPLCDTCRGAGRVEVTSRSDRRVCPACGGRGIPRSLRDAVYDGLSRSEWKATRQAVRS